MKSKEQFIWYGELYGLVDGDTFKAHIDQGGDHWVRNQRIRLYDCDTPETRLNKYAKDPEKMKAFGEAVVQYVQGLYEYKLDGEKSLRLPLISQAFDRDAFTRFLVDIPVPQLEDRSLRSDLLKTRFAITYFDRFGKPKDKATRTAEHEENMEELIKLGKLSL